MKNIKTYDNFSEKNKTVVLNYEDFMVNEVWGISTAIKNLYNKATTTGKQRDIKQQTKTEEEDIDVETSNVNRMDAKKPEGGVVKKTGTKIFKKLSRELTGTNAFIDTKSGKIAAMDVILSEEDLKKVIDLWKSGNKDGAADILFVYALRERDAQFNIAVGLMMSASIAGLKSLKSKIIPKIDLNSLDSARKAIADWAKKVGGGNADEYGKDFVRDTSSGVAKNVSNAIKKVPVPSIDAAMSNTNVTFNPPKPGVGDMLDDVAQVVRIDPKNVDAIKDLSKNIGDEVLHRNLFTQYGTEPGTKAWHLMNKAINYAKDNGDLNGDPDLGNYVIKNGSKAWKWINKAKKLVSDAGDAAMSNTNVTFNPPKPGVGDMVDAARNTSFTIPALNSQE